jgi:alpha-N-acetylglucosamine transferase
MLFYINSGFETISNSNRRLAIVSIAVGDTYIKTWTELCKASWEQYAETVSADIIVIVGAIDKSDRANARSVAWQKLLILDQPWAKQYDRILWLDSDIIISRNAPNIFSYAPEKEKIGICLAGSRLSDIETVIFYEKSLGIQLMPDISKIEIDEIANNETREAYKQHKTPKEHDKMFNTGVMVLSPQFHDDLFLKAYEHEDCGRLYEQPILSHEIIERHIAHLVSPRFNWGMHETIHLYFKGTKFIGESDEFRHQLASYFVRAELANAYFLHFYASMNLMKRLSYKDVF